jgi:hypothetical protein
LKNCLDALEIPFLITNFTKLKKATIDNIDQFKDDPLNQVFELEAPGLKAAELLWTMR